MKYKCVKSFDVNKLDEDCMSTDKYVKIKKNTVWERKAKEANFIDDEFIHLDSEDYGWIEIDIDTLEKNFILMS